MIEIEHLSKRYGEHLAVDDLSYQTYFQNALFMRVSGCLEAYSKPFGNGANP